MKIIHKRNECIGCGACALVCPKYWRMGEDGKSNLLGSKKNDKEGYYELDIKNVNCNKEAEKACPVNIISIID